MKTQDMIVIFVLITLTMGQAKEELEILKEMITELKLEMTERLVHTEVELAITKNDLAEALADLATTKVDLESARNDVTANHFDLATTKDDLAVTKAKTDELQREVAILRSSPFLHTCGSHYDYLVTSHQTIPYTSLLYSSTNTEGGGLDITTGVFTAPTGGSYSVSWDLVAGLDHGQYLQKNGENILESASYSDNGGPSGYIAEQGGRTMVLYLGIGDTLQLYLDHCLGQLAYITFCVSLSTPDLNI